MVVAWKSERFKFHRFKLDRCKRHETKCGDTNTDKHNWEKLLQVLENFVKKELYLIVRSNYLKIASSQKFLSFSSFAIWKSVSAANSLQSFQNTSKFWQSFEIFAKITHFCWRKYVV